MIKLFKLASSIMLLSFASATAHAGLILSADGTEVLGVDGINIGGGVLGTFDFVEGTFDGLYGGVAPSFARRNIVTQVRNMFVGTSFANKPTAIVGCTDPLACVIYFPDRINDVIFNEIYVSTVSIHPSRAPEAGSDFPIPRTADIASEPRIKFAKFRPTAVPEPSTMGLFGLSLLGLGFARRANGRGFKVD